MSDTFGLTQMCSTVSCVLGWWLVGFTYIAPLRAVPLPKYDDVAALKMQSPWWEHEIIPPPPPSPPPPPASKSLELQHKPPSFGSLNLKAAATLSPKDVDYTQETDRGDLRQPQTAAVQVVFSDCQFLAKARTTLGAERGTRCCLNE